MTDLWYKRSNNVDGGGNATISSQSTRIRVDSKTRLVVGTVIGSVVGLVLILVTVLLWRQYCRERNRRDASGEQPTQSEVGTAVQPEVEANLPHGRPSSVYSARPLSDPFAAEVKTVVSTDDPSLKSPLSSPQKEEFSISGHYPPYHGDQGSETGEPPHHDVESLVEPDSLPMRMSTDTHDMPRLSRTFVANVRPTARSPPPL